MWGRLYLSHGVVYLDAAWPSGALRLSRPSECSVPRRTDADVVDESTRTHFKLVQINGYNEPKNIFE